ncbi:MAG: hypothetical protein FWD61_02205 [Phycisphaerales bacterium]|nr:hypothetical protein [Phycisphaerales bacterium]
MFEIADKVIDGIKLLRETTKKMQNAELQGQIADLMLASADMKLEMVELKAKILKVREENAELKRTNDLRANIEIREKNHVYLKSPILGYNQGPFCPICLEIDGKLINIWESSMGWCCPHCEKNLG